MAERRRLLVPSTGFGNFVNQDTTTLGSSTIHAAGGTYTLSDANTKVSFTNSTSSYVWGADIYPNTGHYYWEGNISGYDISGIGFNYHGFIAYSDATGTSVTSSGNSGYWVGGAYSGVGISSSTDGFYNKYTNGSSSYTTGYSGMAQGNIFGHYFNSNTGYWALYDDDVLLASDTLDSSWHHAVHYFAGRTGNSVDCEFDLNNMTYTFLDKET